MLKLVAASTLALSALAASIPFAHAGNGRPGDDHCGMQFAPAADAMQALTAASLASARTLSLASELARYGTANASASALLVAAGMIEDLDVAAVPGSALSFTGAEALLADARTLAGEDAALVALIDDRLEAGDRGSVFDVEPMTGQGGESWVDAGDSFLFTRTYDDDTDAVLTLIAGTGDALDVRVLGADGELLCEGALVDGAHSCVWPAVAGLSYDIQITNQAENSAAFTVWTN
ncbi:MAG: hypothetical protein R3F55_04680 [Alphaproteobacteria bacterium]